LRNEGVPVQGDQYTPRFVADKGGYFDMLKGGFNKVTTGSALGKTAPSFKHRIMMAIENPLGERKVVSIKKEIVTAWEGKKSNYMGKLKFTTDEAELDKELKPINDRIQKLTKEQSILSLTESRQEAAKQRIRNIKETLTDLENKKEEILDKYNPAQLSDKKFVDRNGNQWKIKQATTDEIEKHTDLKYYKHVLLNELINYNNLRKVERNIEYLENLKSDPEFQKIAIKIGTRNIPDDYRTTDLPQLRGYVFPKRIAEVFDSFYKKAATGLLDTENLYGHINAVLRNAIFFNPLMHIPNIGVHWAINRGATPFLNPKAYPRLLKTTWRAINATLTMNDDYVEALENGAAMLYSKTANRNLYKVMLEKMGAELEQDPGLLESMGKALGYANPARLIKAIYSFSNHVTWAANDIATLQAMYEEMALGKTMEKAIADVGKHIPNYRIPPRIMNSTLISKLMKTDSGITMFGAYHYGALKSYWEMAKSLFEKKSDIKERAETLDKLAMLILTGFVIYPALDKIATTIFGDKEHPYKIRRAGATTFPYRTYEWAKGKIDFPAWVQSVLTPSIGLQVGIEAYTGRDWRTGKRISIPEIAARSLSPAAYGERIAKGELSPKDFLASFIGVSKAESPYKKTMNLAVQFKKKHGIAVEEPGTYPPSKYRGLENSLTDNDVQKAKKAWKQLVKESGKSDEEIEAGLKESLKPHFVSKTLEQDFRKSLHGDEKTDYWKAVNEKKKMLERFELHKYSIQAGTYNPHRKGFTIRKGTEE
jgi:hypothetical protein